MSANEMLKKISIACSYGTLEKIESLCLELYEILQRDDAAKVDWEKYSTASLCYRAVVGPRIIVE